MKELSIEEKAKRYDEAIEMAKKELNVCGSQDCDAARQIFRFFPELKESEDEKIRKAIHIYLDWLDGKKDYAPKGEYTIKDMIAWLNKQGKHQKFRDSIQVGDKVTRNEDGVLVNLSQLNRVAKPAAKFHKGDWVIHQGTENVYQVVAIIDNQYQLKYGDNYTTQYCEDVDRCARLWTIQDAKDGDVLSDGTTIFIFKDLLSDGSVMSYCDYDTDSGESDAFCPLSVNLMCSKITPATKEQRDTLEKAMADAEYTFNFEKKELKKIEQKTADLKTKAGNWYICDMGVVNENMVTAFRRGEIYYCPKDGYLDVSGALFEVGGLDVFRLATEKEIPQPKQEWSDEDNEHIKSIISTIECSKAQFPNSPAVLEAYNSDLIWLKSLRPQNHWKPSDEQMKALNYVVNLMALSERPTENDLYYNILKSLREQLEKLRENKL